MSPLTPPIQLQPHVNEWIELYDRVVISREELRHQLALATNIAISSPTLDDSSATKAGEAAEQGVAVRQAAQHRGVLPQGSGTPVAAAGSVP